MIGTPSNPDVVYSDPAVLTNLRRRDLAAGLAATLKIGLAHDSVLFERLEQCCGEVLDESKPDTLHHLVRHASTSRLANIQHKGRDLGVPFAHALEATCRYSGVLHGEALAWGIALATGISANRRLMNEVMVERVLGLLVACEVIRELPAPLLRQAIDSMDLGQRGTMVLPVTIGTVTDAIKPSVADAYAALDMVRQHPAFCDLRPNFRNAA